MKSKELYLSLDEPDNSDHLWRYSPWKRIHPTGNIREIPVNYKQPDIKLSLLDGSDVPSKFTISKQDNESKKNSFSDPVSMSFIESVSHDSKFTLKVENNTAVSYTHLTLPTIYSV